VASEIYSSIKQEFDLTCGKVLEVTLHDEILDTESWLQHSIKVRNPYVDPLNYIQVALLERLRSGEQLSGDDHAELIRILSNSVNGIAAGLQNVG
jgi:phosphoenolpyruvate carboxylase